MRINTPLTLSGCRRLIYGQLTDGKTHITTELEQDSESPQFLTRAMSAGHSAVGKDGKREGEEGETLFSTIFVARSPQKCYCSGQ